MPEIYFRYVCRPQNTCNVLIKLLSVPLIRNETLKYLTRSRAFYLPRYYSDIPAIAQVCQESERLVYDWRREQDFVLIHQMPEASRIWEQEELDKLRESLLRLLPKLGAINGLELRLHSLPTSIADTVMETVNLENVRTLSVPQEYITQIFAQDRLTVTKIKLWLTGCNNNSFQTTKENVVDPIVKYCPNLKSLTIHGIYLAEGDFYSEFMNFKFLTELDILGVIQGDGRASLGDLKSLRRLKISHSKHLPIPSSINKLENLEELVLSLHTRYKMRLLPHEISECTKLRHLEAIDHDIQSKTLSKLVNLEFLHVNSVDHEPYEEGPTANWITNLVKLETYISGMLPIPQEMGKLTNLRRIDVTCLLTSGLHVLGNLPKLEELKFKYEYHDDRYNYHYDNHGNGFRDLKSLKKLDIIDFRMIDDDQMIEISELTSMVDLSIVAESLNENFRNLNRLVRLEVTRLKTLPASLGELKGTLRFLRLYQASFEKLPNVIRELVNLNVLDCSRSELCELPQWIGELNQLGVLVMSRSNLTSIPDSIGDLHNLYSLWIDENKLTEVPDTIGNLVNLMRFACYGNNFERLPDSLCNLARLRTVQCDRSQYKLLPTNISNLAEII